MKKLLKILGGLVALLLILAIGAHTWATVKVRSALGHEVAVHIVDFPIPFPLPDSEVTRLKINADSAARLATARAVERGRHLVQSRYPCAECHGQNFGGGVMVDEAVFARLLGPNITLGRGTRSEDFRAADWDRIVRHGIRRDRKLAAMPSQEFQHMSDQELSDIVSYIRSFPPVDSQVPPSKFGPIGTLLVATGKLPLAADLITDHYATHAEFPPPTEATVAFGKHVAASCSGCHQANFAGGPIAAGDPAWPPAKNLTPHPDALGKWTLEQFKSTLRTGKRPDGTELKLPMSLFVPYANKMSDVEFEALWMYLRSLPAVAPPTR